MDAHHHNITATAGHEDHGVHLCHRCGWPFPNPHPSAKHRRAHKRVCGTVEGYKIMHSEDHDHHLAVSDDDNASDNDEHHTPSPNIVKKNAGSNGIEGEKSVKSEDDVFSDAVTDFSDSGISPRLEERFESVRELGKSLEQKSVEGDLHGIEILDAEEASDRIEQSNDERSEEISKHEPLANGNNSPDNVILMTDAAAKLVSVELKDDSQLKHDVGRSLHSETIPGQDADFQVQENSSASVPLYTEEGKVLDQTVAAGESQEIFHNKFVSEVAKHDPSPPSESLEYLDASEGINTAVDSAEISTSTKTVEAALANETDESRVTSVGFKAVSHSTENIGFTESVDGSTSPGETLLCSSSVKSNESTKMIDINEQSDVACTVSSIDKEEMPKASFDGGQTAGNFNLSGETKSDLTGYKSLESKNMNSVDISSALSSTDNVFACEDDITTIAKKDVNHCGESINSRALETGNEKGEGASVEVDVIADSMLPSEKLTDCSSPCAADSDAKSLLELSENNSSSFAFRDDGFENSIQDHDADKVNEVPQQVCSTEAGSEADHDIGDDALHQTSISTFSFEHTVPPVTSELPNNIHLGKDEAEVESLNAAETPEDSISKDSSSPPSDSVLLSKNVAKDDNCAKEDSIVSGAIGTAEVTAKDHESSIETSEISESSTPCVQEASPDVKPTHSSDDVITSKSVGIIPSAELTLDGKGLASDECSKSSNASSVLQPVPSPSNVQEFATSDIVDKALVNAEDVTSVNSKGIPPEVDDKSTKQTDDASAIDVSGCLTSRSDSLEANCGSVVSDTLETNSQKHKTPSDTFEPPSFMTLVQCGSEGDQVATATEIEAVQNNQQPKSDALQAAWFPSLTNVVNESEGRKKNEEMIAKVTNWSPVKQQHSPLKSLLSEVKSPNTKQVPAANQKVEAETKDDNVGVTTVSSVLASETHTTNDQDTNKHSEEWNSPARYPIEIKKEKKGRSFWVPFVCCSSAH